MKKFYPFLLAFVCIMVTYSGFAQPVLIDDNHSLTGFPFNDKIILTSDLDSTIWISNGTPGGTSQIATNVKNGNESFAIFNGKVYFGGIDPNYGDELWSLDVVNRTAQLVSDIWSGTDSSKPDDFITFNNNLYFTAFTPDYGRELYQYTGSGAPARITDLNPNGANSFDDPTYYFNNSILYFTATNATGEGLYTFTTSGITRIMDFPAGSDLSTFSHIGNTVFFMLTNAGNNLSLYKTDGTAPSLLKSFSGSTLAGSIMVPYNDNLVFAASDNGLNVEPWITNGSTPVMIKDINPGGFFGASPMLANSVILSGKLIFSATTDTSGAELWSTDGTEAGTKMLININSTDGEGSNPFLWPVYNAFDYSDPGNYIKDPYDRTANYNGSIFFSADAGSGRQLWKTDGTADGTKLVKTLNSAGDGVGYSAFYTSSGVVFSGSDGPSGFQPWISDGSDAGTRQITPAINPSGDANPIFMFLWNGDIYLTADNGNGITEDYADFYKLTGPFSSLPISLTDFSAHANSNSVQLAWNTSSENNSHHFNVQRSTNGVNFSSIGEVAAAGTSNTVKKYDFTDEAAYSLGTSQLYYRLEMVDKDGKSSFSKIVPVTLSSLPVSVRIFPNPVHDVLKIQYNSATRSNILIVDISGKELYRGTAEPSPNGIYEVNVSNFPTGTFFLKFKNDSTASTQKFIRK